LAACRAVLFAQLVDDPTAWPDRFPTEEDQDAERKRLHKVIERLVPWEASNNEHIVNEARWEIARSVAWGLGEEPPAQNSGPAILRYLKEKGAIDLRSILGGRIDPAGGATAGLACFWLRPQSGGGADRQSAGGNPDELCGPATCEPH
jgi:putative DNA methylase